MIDIGINYITEQDNPKNRYDNIYKFLIEKGYINTVKFPGKYCNYEVLDYVINMAKETNVKLDIHGLPDMFPAISSMGFIREIDWKKLKQHLFQVKNLTRISTHMGLANKDKIEYHTKGLVSENLEKNTKKLKKRMKKILKNPIEIGLENIPGGFQFDLETLTPEFISQNWEKVDFGVFDIAHAKLSAKELNMSYEEYLKEIKHKEYVKILHVSGNIDETNKYADKPDKHILIHKDEIKDIIKTLQVFNNIDLVVTEYAYNTKYSYEKELMIETITLYNIIKTMDEKFVKKALEMLEENLKEDISNIQQILHSEEWKELNNM